MITVSTLSTRLDNKRRDTTSGNITSSDKISAINAAINQLRAVVDISTAVERKYFTYLPGIYEYSVANNLGLTDFSNVKQIRIANEPDQVPWERCSANDFTYAAGNKNAFAIEGVDEDTMLKVSYLGSAIRADIHNASAYNNNGTWAADLATSDAENVASDTAEYWNYRGSIKFDVDVSNSVNNYAQISVSDMAAVNLSSDALNGRARIRMKVFIPAGGVTDLTNFGLFWGSSSTNYWSETATAQATGGGFQADAWNDIEFDWTSASVTGSPDASAIDYLNFRVTYGAGYTDKTGFRINDIVAYEPKRLELMYYSDFWVDNGTGTARQEEVTTLTGAERITIPGAYLELLADGAVADIFHQQGSATANEYEAFQAKFVADAPAMFRAIGTKKLNKGDIKAKPRNPWPSW